MFSRRPLRESSETPVTWWPQGSNASRTGGQLNNAPSGFPGGAVVENLPANAGDTGSSPGLGGSHMPRSD